MRLSLSRFRRSLAILFVLGLTLPGSSAAWNGAGHRLVAVMAWQHMQPATRDWVSSQLARHPDFERWQEKSRQGGRDGAAVDLFAEAATWADDIRQDPRFHDETRESPTPPLAGLPETARRKRWHYVDLDAQDRVVAGELDARILDLSARLRSTTASGPESNTLPWALPWLIHLVGDMHQPLHVGKHGDEGGNLFEVEFENRPRKPFGNLHQFWDELPGPSGLRGQRLHEKAAWLLANYPRPHPSPAASWRDETHRLLAQAYPTRPGSLLPVIDPAFTAASRQLAEQQLVKAAWRLASLLDQIARERVSRGTP
jgi:hypothetical protein